MRWLMVSVLLGLAGAAFWGCTSGRVAVASELFQQVQPDTSGLLRGVALGEPFTQAIGQERVEVLQTDEYGVLFRQRLTGRQFLDVEYWRHPTDTSRLAAICLNVHLSDEVSARDLFRELADYFNRRFDIQPEGSFGQYVWWLENDTRRLELKFENLKRDLTVSLVESTR